MIVLYFHAHDEWFATNIALLNAAHSSVVIFFVLSGYVISYTTLTNNRGASQYALARLSRLCSMVVPALLLTAAVELIVKQVDAGLFENYTRGVSWPRYLLSGLFINEIWFLSAAPPINMPLWSLSYEFWYYVIFGLWFYGSSSRRAILLPVIAALIAGPKILLMMPIWLVGYAAYYYSPPSYIKKYKSGLLFLCTFLIIFCVFFLPSIPYQIGSPPFFFANQFITDWMVGFLLAVILWLVPLEKQTSLSDKVVSYTRKIANLTFPIYIFHGPLLVLWRAIFKYHHNDLAECCLALISVLIVSAIIGIILERQRTIWFSSLNWALKSIRSLLEKIHVKIIQSKA